MTVLLYNKCTGLGQITLQFAWSPCYCTTDPHNIIVILVQQSHSISVVDMRSLTSAVIKICVRSAVITTVAVGLKTADISEQQIHGKFYWQQISTADTRQMLYSSKHLLIRTYRCTVHCCWASCRTLLHTLTVTVVLRHEHYWWWLSRRLSNVTDIRFGNWDSAFLRCLS